MGNPMPELTLTHFIAGFNSRKWTKNLGTDLSLNRWRILDLKSTPEDDGPKIIKRKNGK